MLVDGNGLFRAFAYQLFRDQDRYREIKNEMSKHVDEYLALNLCNKMSPAEILAFKRPLITECVEAGSQHISLFCWLYEQSCAVRCINKQKYDVSLCISDV
jgi:hypothetical protein